MAKQWTAESIAEMVAKRERSADMVELRAQMEYDFDLFTLTPFTGRPKHIVYTSPRPKNDFLKVKHSVDKAELTIAIELPDDAPKERRERASKAEDFLVGFLAGIDAELRKAGKPRLRESIASDGGIRGMTSLCCLLYTEEDEAGNKQLARRIERYDPFTVTWLPGDRGPAWIAFKYELCKSEAEDRYGVTLEVEDDESSGMAVTVIDFFDRTVNASVLLEGKLATQDNRGVRFVKDPTPHGLRHVPGWVGFAGSIPDYQSSKHKATLKYRAMSVWNASRQSYQPLNQQISFIMDTAEKSVAGTLKFYSESGEEDLDHSPYEHYQVLKLKRDVEDVVPLETPKVPPESATILSVVDRDIQMSTIPHPLGYGIDSGNHSGAALSAMGENMRSIYGPQTSLVEQAIQWLCEQILQQFKLKAPGPVRVSGVGRNGHYFEREFSPMDVDDDWFVVVKCEPKLPRDQAAEVQMAIMATTPNPQGDSLLDMLSARKDILHIQNPDAVDKRLNDERLQRMIRSLPNLEIRKMADQLIAEGRPDLAEELLSSVPAPGSPAGGGEQMTQAVVIAMLQMMPPEQQQAIMGAAQNMMTAKAEKPSQGAPAQPGPGTGGV